VLAVFTFLTETLHNAVNVWACGLGELHGRFRGKHHEESGYRSGCLFGS
jgi:hypothetical protein